MLVSCFVLSSQSPFFGGNSPADPETPGIGTMAAYGSSSEPRTLPSGPSNYPAAQADAGNPRTTQRKIPAGGVFLFQKNGSGIQRFTGLSFIHFFSPTNTTLRQNIRTFGSPLSFVVCFVSAVLPDFEIYATYFFPVRFFSLGSNE